ncbi:hypothetical protein [Klebsiella oxytoca]|uniref:hypothetical protein n=1 Tax=Klebsiella oxytoca TaxID=571 RepID=UPI0020C308CE|nr:hypothetical protein [Klebsiella oxytoca]
MLAGHNQPHHALAVNLHHPRDRPVNPLAVQRFNNQRNGLGITRGTATGKLLADMIAGENNELIHFLKSSPGPNKTPPEPFLSIGVNSVLKWGQYRAGLEV